MKKIIFIILLSFLSFYSIAKDLPERPKGISDDAKWKEQYKKWILHGKYLGDSKMWYQDGRIKVDCVKVKEKYMKEINYFENGKIRVIGQNILLENKFKKGDEKFEWRAYGKWKEYNKVGVLLSELCYTEIFDDDEGEWKAEYCGDEIKYNEDGTVKEKIKHKLECKYGCEELECKDCIKK